MPAMDPTSPFGLRLVTGTESSPPHGSLRKRSRNDLADPKRSTGKRQMCLYETKYARGRPPTPLLTPGTRDRAVGTVAVSPLAVQNGGLGRSDLPLQRSVQPTPLPSRTSPDLGVTEIQGQYVEPTSGLAFLHRAWKRLSRQRPRVVADDSPSGSDRLQLQVRAGDKPFGIDGSGGGLPIPDLTTSTELLSYYFEVCIATYRFLHRPRVEAWLHHVHQNLHNGLQIEHGLGEMKAAVVLTILAIAVFHKGKCSGLHASEDEAVSMRKSDRLFLAACHLADAATGCPTLESVQARLAQVLYLLHSSRMNQAWYVFGNALQTIAALGLHRRAQRPRPLPARELPHDYIDAQCRRRTFWVAYILDVYLGIIFGRPRHYHDENIDQELPDPVNDQDMTTEGPRPAASRQDCSIDSLIYHARIGRIVGQISQHVYAINQQSGDSMTEIVRRIRDDLDSWAASLPVILGSIRPSSLVHPFRRQASAMRLARGHAIMHLNRPFLLWQLGNRSGKSAMVTRAVSDCMSAARDVLEMVEEMAQDGTLFHAFWWTHYVTFCSLAVVYVWKIQRDALGWKLETDSPWKHTDSLFELAESCQLHLAKATASNSPSRRYSIILEELRQEALCKSPGSAIQQSSHFQGDSTSLSVNNHTGLVGNMADDIDDSFILQPSGSITTALQNQWDAWQTTDWLDIDSLALGAFSGFAASPDSWVSTTLDPYQLT
ncbi:hypothetical protein NKR23_g10290 [Pleurostoma richardsiae]|uniref:Xylanolytic transcriptional activator regulatory domain-containing protein n=1 Tax=Pleurostoma richardsiae TaxID=41990 RepID=A0AA38R5D3_9PEZI|nr:hypothetical protein NKR23_g10290 [Pleurostoma richardsiae]